MKTPREGTAVLAATLVVALTLAAGCTDSRNATAPSADVDRVEVPEPDVAGIDASTRQAIVELRTSLASLSGDELGDAYRELGRIYFALGLQEAAEACFRNASRIAADDAESIYFLAVLEMGSGRLPSAVSQLERVLELRQDYTAARIRLGNARIELGNSAGASEELQRALAHVPFSAAAHYSLGKLAAARAEHRAAIEHFRQVLELQPQATRVHYPLALAYRAVGDLEDAERHIGARGDGTVLFPDPWLDELQRVARGAGSLINAAGRAFTEGRFDDAVHGYRRAIESDPRDAEAHRGLALTLERLGDVDGAFDAMSTARQLRPDDCEIERGLGLLLLSKGKPEEALPHLRLAVNLDHDSVDGQLALARGLQSIGDLDGALRALDTALEIDPLRRGAKIDRASVLHSSGRVDEALVVLRAVAISDPDYDDARLRLGVVLAGEDRFEEARSVWVELLRRDVAGPLRAQVLFNLGVLESARGNADGAHDRFRDAVAADPNHDDALFFYAAGLARDQRYAEAAERLSQVVDRQPLNARARLAEVTASIFSGQYERARRRLEEGLARTPGEAQFAIALAKLLAIAPDDHVRDGSRALDLARKLYVERPTLEHAEVLAMAHAETGGWSDAVDLQREIVARANEMGQADLVAQFRVNLARYERGEPALSPWPGGR